MTSPASQLRNQKLKQFVEEALDAGVFYERDLQDRINIKQDYQRTRL